MGHDGVCFLIEKRTRGYQSEILLDSLKLTNSPGGCRGSSVTMTANTGAYLVPSIGCPRKMNTRSTVIRDFLLLTGVLSSAVYVMADVLCGLRYPDYSFADQVISELSAIGAPTAALWSRLLQAFAALFAAFTIGVLREGRSNRRLRLTGWLLTLFVLSGPLWAFFPMHQRGDVFTWTDIGHIVLGGATVVLMTAVMAVGAGALEGWFRPFSQILLAVAVVSGIATFAYVPRMINQLPTPGVGTIERISLYTFFLWTGVLGIALLRRRRADTGAASEIP
jgi:hypothetical protein